MPPGNRLAPMSQNAFGAPPTLAEIQLAARTAQRPAPLTLGERAQEINYGLGRGFTNVLQGNLGLAQALYQDPRAVGSAFVDAARQFAANPVDTVGNSLRGMWNRAKSGPAGLGEVLGENIDPRNFLKPRKAVMSQANSRGALNKLKYVRDKFEQRGDELVHADTGEKIASSKIINLKDGTPVSLLQMVDKYGDEGTIAALTPSGEMIGKLNYAIGQEGFHPDVFIEEPFRRQGLATSMYDLAEATGGVIPPYNGKGSVRTPMGEAFRKNRAGRK